jgi:glycosyltransferase involved in cell wall biosynthesis
MKPPLISIIVPTYNQEKYLGRCLRSILSMNFRREDYEIIIINDASTDHTKTVLHAFIDEIRIIENEKNIGLPASLNRGLKEARGRFFVRVDSDDYVHLEYINLLSMHLLINGEIDAVCCDYNLVDEDEKIISRKKWLEEPIGCGIMFRLDDIIKLGLYDEKMLFNEDKDLLIRFLDEHNIYNIPLPLYRYRRHNNNITNNKIEMNDYIEKLKEKHSSSRYLKKVLD